MNPILDLLQEMRGRVAMYTGSQSLHELAAFLRGYDYALTKCGRGPTDEFLNEFGNWLRERFNVTISRSWEEIILFHSADENEAMKQFWDLLDVYSAKTRIPVNATLTGEKKA